MELSFLGTKVLGYESSSYPRFYFMEMVWLGSLVVSVSDPMTARSGVRSIITSLSSNNLGQVVHIPQHVGAMPQFGGPED